ncbi:MAG TPA: hypothetical protein DCR17_13070 [Verrucomicrobiales bacterium]|nr:hypothetical protein [Pedosphaera sp.]HAO67602.1 hypothetical protein [Verrucomicrobiales bacterium]
MCCGETPTFHSQTHAKPLIHHYGMITKIAETVTLIRATLQEDSDLFSGACVPDPQGLIPTDHTFAFWLVGVSRMR